MPSRSVVGHLTADQQHVWDEHHLIKLLLVAFNCIACISERATQRKREVFKAAVSKSYRTGCQLHSWFIASSADVLSVFMVSHIT